MKIFLPKGEKKNKVTRKPVSSSRVLMVGVKTILSRPKMPLSCEKHKGILVNSGRNLWSLKLNLVKGPTQCLEINYLACVIENLAWSRSQISLLPRRLSTTLHAGHRCGLQPVHLCNEANFLLWGRERGRTWPGKGLLRSPSVVKLSPSSLSTDEEEVR